MHVSSQFACMWGLYPIGVISVWPDMSMNVNCNVHGTTETDINNLDYVKCLAQAGIF